MATHDLSLFVLSPSRMRKAELFYEHHGIKGLLASRLIPGLRTPLFFTAGSAGVNFFKFLFTDALAAMVSVSVLIFLGWYFPTQMSQLKNTTVIYEWVIVGIIACVVGVVIFIRIRKSRIKETAAGEGHAEEDTVKEYNPINSGSCVEAILYSGYAKRGK